MQCQYVAKTVASKTQLVELLSSRLFGAYVEPCNYSHH
jgi:hypothetical protein